MKKASNSKSILDEKNFDKNKELITRKDIENSPFQVIGIKGKYFGVMGKYRITEEREKEKEVEEELKVITWDRIIQVILLINELSKEDKHIIEKTQ